MNRLVLFAMLITASCYLFAQNTPPPVTYTLKGVLLDSLSMEGEPYATIRIVKKQAPDKPVKLAVTDNNGKFQEQISGSGDYIMSITSIGKTSVVKEFTLEPANKTMDFGTLFTMEDANELAAVEVVAQKPLVKVDIDKIEYNIQDDPDSQTNSMLEMLRKVPLVTVDGEDNIQVNGSSSFKVHVNGKPNNMMSNNPKEVLKSMPANSIKYIEVITDPGAKYDAEGVGGILNIVTMGGGFEGYTVTLSGNVSNTGVGGSAYGTIQKGKFTMTGNYGYSYNDNPRSYSNRLSWIGNSIPEETDGWSKGHGSFQHGNMEASYEIDTLRLVTMGFGLYGSGNDSKSNSLITMKDNYSYTRFGNGDNSWYSIRGNIDYQRMFKLKGRMFTFSYRLGSEPQNGDNYSYYDNIEIINDEALNESYLKNRHYNSKTNTMEHTFQGDYITPIGEYHTVETGLKYISRNNTSDTKDYLISNNTEILDEDRSVDYKHLNDIFAAYAGYTLRYKSLSGKAGLRYERTMLDVEYKRTPEKNFDTSYDDIVPSVSLGVKIDQTQNIRAGYGMRIWRPSIYFLNPYVDETNPRRKSYGNPDLDTEKNHNFNISYSSFSAKFNVNMSLRHSFTNNSIERYMFEDEDGILNSTFENAGKTRYTGLSAYINWNASPLTRMYINANGGYGHFESKELNLKNSGWDVFMYGGIQQSLPHDFRISLNLMGSSPRVSLQGRRSGFYNYSLGVNKSFLDKRLTVSAFASNVFTKYRKMKDISSGTGFRDENRNEYFHQRFGVSVSYRIGDLKAQVKKAARTITNDDVKSGEGGGGESSGGN